MTTANLQALPTKTFEEYIDWGMGLRAEWVDGKVELKLSVSLAHQEVCGFLMVLLSAYVEEHKLGQVLGQTFVMRLGASRSGREPDVMFVATENAARIRHTFVDGPADLVIEIVSPESETRDWETKRSEYERGGVREYWIIDPLMAEAIFNQLQPDGTYQAATVGDDGIYHSVVVQGLWINTNWLWQRPLPTLISVLQRWQLV